MIAVLACTCSNSDKLARKVLESAGHPQAMSLPIIRGKGSSLTALEGLKRDGYAVDMVEAYIREHSRFVLFVGLRDPEDPVYYRDVASGSTTQRLEAEALVKAFAF